MTQMTKIKKIKKIKKIRLHREGTHILITGSNFITALINLALILGNRV